MSSIVERANAEADAAEAENPDAEPVEPIAAEDAPPETETEASPEPSSLAVVEELDKKLRSEATRHENALAKLHPEDWDQYTMCPLCIADGFLQPVAPGEMPDQLWEAITVLAGRQDTGELANAPFAEICDVCKGKTVVRTHAVAGDQTQVPCRACAGFGWLDIGPYNAANLNPPNKKQVPLAPAPVAGVNPYPNAPTEPFPDSTIEFTPFVGGVSDPYGRPAGHPRWGMTTDANGRQL